MTLHQSTKPTNPPRSPFQTAFQTAMHSIRAEETPPPDVNPWPAGCQYVLDIQIIDDEEVDAWCWDTQFERPQYERHYRPIFVDAISETSHIGDSDYLDDLDNSDAEWQCASGHYVNDPQMVAWLNRRIE